MLLMFSFAEFYAMEIICYTHCYSTRTVMATIYSPVTWSNSCI